LAIDTQGCGTFCAELLGLCRFQEFYSFAIRGGGFLHHPFPDFFLSRVLFKIKTQEGKTESDIIDHLCSRELASGADSMRTNTARCLLHQHCDTSCTKGAQCSFYVLLPRLPGHESPVCRAADKYACQHHAQVTSQTRQLSVTAECSTIGASVSTSAECYLTRFEARKATPVQVAWQQYHNILQARSFKLTVPHSGAVVSDLRRGTRVRVCAELSGGRTFPSLGSVGTVVTKHTDMSVRVYFEDLTVQGSLPEP
jgi:hypothetical protein